MVEISTSILSVEKEKIIDTIYDLENAKTDYFHVDVMDGEFVKNDTHDLMLEYGAVNAANLDGGNSSALVENYQILNKPIDWYNREQTRPIPNGFILVK